MFVYQVQHRSWGAEIGVAALLLSSHNVQYSYGALYKDTTESNSSMQFQSSQRETHELLYSQADGHVNLGCLPGAAS